MARHTKLSELPATAICGNDILSSCLYVSGIAITFAGIWAPLVLLAVAIVLAFYKSVYTEVVEALPINGGAYNGLLNGTSKIVAAIAGVMTVLSYMATAVISAKVGVEYLSTIISLPIIPTTLVLLGIFAALVISGVRDSAKVALIIFLIHLSTLFATIALGLWYIYLHGGTLIHNIHATQLLFTNSNHQISTQLFLAFSASLLGVSGFESSANFVEEQGSGVFRKTLKNMLVGVGVFNPLIAFIILGSLPLAQVGFAKDFVLSEAGAVVGGSWFRIVIVIDAFLVLSGAVLASFVGVSGLLSRMAGDGCIPEFFNKHTTQGSYPRIIIGFFLLTCSVLLATGGNLLSLAGVYTIAFLSVMTLFAFGNLILKETRTELKRTYSAPVGYVIVAFLATGAGIVGNILIDPQNLSFFGLYFLPSILIVFTVVYLDYVLKFLIRYVSWIGGLGEYLNRVFEDVIRGHFVVFVHNSHRLYPALEYILRNETGTRVTIVHCPGEQSPRLENGQTHEIERLIPELQKAGAFPNFQINFIYKNKPFGPELVKEVARELKVRNSRILIGSIHHSHEFDYQDFGGVRIIF